MPNLASKGLRALSLAACQQQPAKPKEEAQAAAKPEPDAKPGVAVEGARLVLPAVKGNPGAAYFLLDNRSGGTVMVSAIAIEGAGKAEIHQTVSDSMIPVDRIEVAAGTSLKLEPGKLHAMVSDLSPKLAAGGKTEMTIVFADGDKLSTPLAIEAAGGAMEGMDHGDMR
jgi:copper(I)-binding protein